MVQLKQHSNSVVAQKQRKYIADAQGWGIFDKTFWHSNDTRLKITSKYLIRSKCDLKRVPYLFFVTMATQSARRKQIFPYLSTGVKTSASEPEVIRITKTSQTRALSGGKFMNNGDC